MEPWKSERGSVGNRKWGVCVQEELVGGQRHVGGWATGQRGVIRSGTRCKALSPACGKIESDCVLPVSGCL